jgi:hypothetical protein
MVIRLKVTREGQGAWINQALQSEIGLVFAKFSLGENISSLNSRINYRVLS